MQKMWKKLFRVNIWEFFKLRYNNGITKVPGTVITSGVRSMKQRCQTQLLHPVYET